MTNSPRENFWRVEEEIKQTALHAGRKPEEIQLVIVTKQCSFQVNQSLYEIGCRDFGENRVQELKEKSMLLPSDIQWHFIGTLQRNKTNAAIQIAALIHSVDSLELAQAISECSRKLNKNTSILLQVNVSGEQSKRGLCPDEWERCLQELNTLPFINVRGLMTMAPLTEDFKLIRHCFASLRKLRDQWQHLMREPALFKELSMGMSHDFKIAIEEGATLLRLGTIILK